MQKIKGTTKVCGLIGNPVAHSFSPLIHNELAQQCGIDLVYVPFKVEQEHLQEAIAGAQALQIAGLNVTVPHKQAVIPYLCYTDPLAKAIGAVNTLVLTEQGYAGYNTDILGFSRELEENGISLRDREVVILGAGGAARAIAFYCVSAGAMNVHILNRTYERAAELAAVINAHFKSSCAMPGSLQDAGNLDFRDYLVVQTSSVGLYPHCNEAILQDKGFYKYAAAGVDLIYNPLETQFMKNMRRQGKNAYSGLQMLLYQAVASFELWNSCKVDQQVIQETAQLLQKAMQEAR